jgi:hypothetical protein
VNKQPLSHEELLNLLWALSNKWEVAADEAHARSENAQAGEEDMHRAYYFRGLADSFKRSMQELRAILEDGEAVQQAAEPILPMQAVEVEALLNDAPLVEEQPPLQASEIEALLNDIPSPIEEAAPLQAVEVAAQLGETEVGQNHYAAVSRDVALKILRRGGVEFRDLILYDDNTFSVLFSNRPPATLEERVSMVQRAHRDLVVLDSGTAFDSRTPFVDFAFRRSPREYGPKSQM